MIALFGPDWAAPVLGLAGVLAGATFAYVGGQRAGRRAYNGERISRQIDYVAEVVHAAESQVIIHGRIVAAMDKFIAEARATLQRGQEPDVHFRLPDELEERYRSTVESWRLVFAKRIVWAHEPMQAAMVRFDRARGAAANDYNVGRVPRAATEVLEQRLSELYAAINVVINTMNYMLADDLLIGPSKWRARRGMRGKLRKAEERLEQMIASTGVEGSPPSGSPHPESNPGEP